MTFKDIKGTLSGINEAFDTALSEGKDLKEQMEEAKQRLTELAEELLDDFGYEEDIPVHAETFAKLLIANYTAASVYPEKFSEFTGEFTAKNAGGNQKESAFGKENPFRDENKGSRSQFHDDPSIDAPSLNNSMDNSF